MYPSRILQPKSFCAIPSSIKHKLSQIPITLLCDVTLQKYIVLVASRIIYVHQNLNGTAHWILTINLVPKWHLSLTFYKKQPKTRCIHIKMDYNSYIFTNS